MSYQVSDEQAIANAGQLVKETGVDCIKLEGGSPCIISRVKAINEAGILVMGHIGLTPQFMGQIGGYKAQGQTAEAALNLIKQAKLLEEAGACSLLVEGVPAIVDKIIADRANIPVLGIGAGPYTHGQLLIYADMLGFYDKFTPKFVKKYANLNEIILSALQAFVQDVKNSRFPVETEHTYKMSDQESKMLLELLEHN